MMGWFGGTRYSRLRTVRVLPSGVVERKYRRNGKEIIWKQVDCFTLSPSKQPRLCSRDYKTRLLRTAV